MCQLRQTKGGGGDEGESDVVVVEEVVVEVGVVVGVGFERDF